MKSIKLCWLCCAAASSLWAVPVAAEMQETGASAVMPAQASFGRPAASAALDRLRGGTLTTQNDMRLAGTTAGNTADHVVTGVNAIDSGAFSNMSGLAVSIQNSGANVLIQNAVILNLQMN